jgi:FG-GAP repeat/Dockerin type I domain
MSSKNRAIGFVAGVVVCGLGGSAIGQVVNEDSKVVAFNGAHLDQFGYAVDLDNGLLVVGAPRDDEQGADTGAAYLFIGATGVQVAKLMPDDPSSFRNFGESVAIDNGVAAVGVRNDDTNGPLSGSVYLFDANTGQQLMKILPADAAPFDEFGISVKIDNGVLAVGAPKDDDRGENSGSVYLYDVATGALLRKISPADGEPSGLFGLGIDLKNGVLAAGAHLGTGVGEFTGVAYVYDVATGAQIAKFIADDGENQDQFGVSVAIGDGVVAVGAPADRFQGTLKGSVYLFDLATGVQVDKLFPSDGASSDSFGRVVETDGEILVIGAWGVDDLGLGSGAAYFYNPDNGNQVAKFLASDGEAGDTFGWSVAIDDGAVAVGARFDTIGGELLGSAYLFNIDCPADFNGDYSYNFLDISALINLINSGDPSADFNNDGSINFFDISAFLSAFSAGCP